ncbi:hypothetical protein [Hydrogenophaga sp.]|uniref:hypothetical protein n=1 Tax=Hydrogenophaga sp. TaxID=1904254 RepID=UPI003F6EB31A
MKISNKRLLVVVVVGILLAAFAFRDWWVHPSAGAVVEKEPLSPTAQGGGEQSKSTPGTAAGNSEQALPAWLGSATGNPDHAVELSVASSKERAARAAQMQASLRKLEKLQRQSNPDPAEVDAALADVEKANGSSVLQGVRLEVLRENLKVAARMQKAAAELQSLQQRNVSGERSVARQAELNQKLAEIQAMQRELRMDFLVDNNKPARP